MRKLGLGIPPGKGEDGSAIVAVTLIGFVVVTMLATIALRSQSSLSSAGGDRARQRAIQVADDGIEAAVLEVARAGSLQTISPGADPGEGNRTRQWAIGQAAAYAPQPAPGGEWVHFRVDVDGSANRRDLIYSVGYIPSKTAALASGDRNHIRVIEAEYEEVAQSVNIPLEHGMATDGDLWLSGGSSFRGTHPYIHANGNRVTSLRADVELSGGAPEEGYTTSSGTCYPNDPSKCVPNQPQIVVPDVIPRNYWYLSQYDLCPDGTMRKGPNYGSTGAADQTGVPSAPGGTPCTGAVLYNATQTAATVNHPRGWRGLRVPISDYDNRNAAANWEYKGGNGTRYDGIYYVLYGNADISAPTANPPVKLTVIAESEEPTDYDHENPSCTEARLTIPIDSHGTPTQRRAWGHFGGNIRTFGSHLAPYDQAEAFPVFLVAGRDINFAKIDNSGGTPGIVMAHEAFKSTSQTMNFTGAVFSNDVCNSTSMQANGLVGHNEISGAGNMPNDWVLTCCEGLTFPFGSAAAQPGPLRLRRWLEL